MRILTEKIVKARKDRRCDSWVQLYAYADQELFDDVAREVMKNSRYIRKGDYYVRQTGIVDGEWVTFTHGLAAFALCFEMEVQDE